SNWTAISGNAVTFTNAGTLMKTAGSGVTAFAEVFNSQTFNNPGTVHVESGTLDIACVGTADGSFLVDAGATLNFGRDTYNLTPASSLTGEGTVNVTTGGASTTAGGLSWGGGTLNIFGTYDVNHTVIPSGTINFNSAASTTDLGLSSGTLAGSGV